MNRLQDVIAQIEKALVNSRLNNKFAIRIAITAVGAAAVAALIWFAAPLLRISGSYPLESAWPRLALIVVELFAIGGAAAFREYQRKQGAERIAQGIGADDSDAPVLTERMRDALATLRGVRGGRTNYLYDLPWYILIGPPGSGKTTALVNSGLDFPLAGNAGATAIAGVGGTRYCDWWFTEDAVLIDTAGRYTTQDSDAQADQKSWLSFLDLLKRSRPRQPINGVLVAISLEDLLTLTPEQIAAHADAIRARLIELYAQLKVEFPVYALFTKADLVIGFMEYFANLNEAERSQVWGATFQTRDKGGNLVGNVPGEFDALVERLNLNLPQRLEEESDATNRVLLFGFPAQIAALRGTIADFLNQIFDPARYNVRAALRGFYFTSGTQEGTPIDQLLGALAKSFGTEGIGARAYSGQGKSFFLTDLVRKVVIGEAGWVSSGARQRLVKAASYSALAILTPLALGAMWLSYSRNSDLIKQSEDASAGYAAIAAPLGISNTVADHDLAKVVPVLHALRKLPGGYEDHAAGSGSAGALGLNPGARLKSAAESAYDIGLERYFRPRLIQRLEEQLEADANDPTALADALKVYLMLGGLKTVDRQLVSTWMERDWAENLYPGPKNAEGRRELEQHLLAMLDLETAHESFVSLNGPLVERSQEALAKVDVAKRAFDILATRAKADLRDDWIAGKNGGAGALVVFDDSVNDVRVPYFFTRAGYEHAFLERVGAVNAEMLRDRWVLGRSGEQPRVAAQYERLPRTLVDAYVNAFLTAWQAALDKLQMRRLTAERPSYPLLAAAASATSPLSQLLDSVRDETSLAGIATRGLPAAPTPTGTSGASPATMIADAMRPYHRLVEGTAGRRPIDLLLADLGDIRLDLSRFATNAAAAGQLAGKLRTEVDKLKAHSAALPSPFARMFDTVGNDVTREMSDAGEARTVQTLRDKVTLVCQDTITGRYPFDRNSERDVVLRDFEHMFGRNGLIDQFASQHVLALADTTGAAWKWRSDAPLSRQLSASALADFQRAAAIRDAFFSNGSPSPSFSLTVTAPPVAGARIEIDGTTVVAGRTGVAQWPGSSEVHRSAVSLDGRRPPAAVNRTGDWSLFRLLDAGQVNEDGTAATFALGGRELTFRFSTSSGTRPLNLSLLRNFHCPSGI